ncbi:DEAD/DEAH box helicase [Anaplasmataceae bacterium AB001_6]|nr:DEAD/DEAH box helicase [Anaplasmataceae bacterium AB001_6]
MISLFDEIAKIRELKNIPNESVEIIIKYFKGKMVKDILLFLPEKVIDRSKGVNDAKKGDIVSIIVTVLGYEERHTKKNSQKYIRVICCSGLSKVKLLYFNSNKFYIKKILSLNNKYYVSGVYSGNNTICHPDIIDRYDKENLFKISVHYNFKDKRITNEKFLLVIEEILNNIQDTDLSLQNSMINQSWLNWINNIKNLHYPPNINEYYNSLSRIKYEEIFTYFLKLQFLRDKSNDKIGRSIIGNGSLQSFFLEKLGFNLTNDQKNALTDIKNDQFSNKKMIRMLQGDVGSGKTLVAVLAALNCIENGKQCCFISPTSVLANQHFNLIYSILNEKININILLGDSKKSIKEKIVSDLKKGEIQLIIGTHSLLQDSVQFFDLGLLIIDEQHKFGVEQRYSIINKNKFADILMMSATPIPRSVLQIFYCDMSCSYIRQKPMGSGNIKTVLVKKKRIDELIKRLFNVLNKDSKLIWVCNAIDKTEIKGLTSVEERFNYLKDIFDQKISFLHSSMPIMEKEKIIHDFKNDDNILILVSTTIIETGVDIANVNSIVIENAERYGFSQLHQLRGRVGRKGQDSFCILLYDNECITAFSKQRIEFLKNSSDGFEIAEQDLKNRGGGDIFGYEQSGIPKFRFSILKKNEYTIDYLKEIFALSRNFYLTNNVEVINKLISLYSEGTIGDDILTEV